MPLYPFKCPKCEKEVDIYSTVENRDSTQICLDCKTFMTRQIITSQAIEIFKEEVWEHIANDPITIRSKKQLKEECKKHGCYSVGYS